MAHRKRYFVKLNNNREFVLGSLQERTNKPKLGIWKELFTYDCCNAVHAVTFDATAYTAAATGTKVRISSTQGLLVEKILPKGANMDADGATHATSLTTSNSGFGTFAYDATTDTLTLSKAKYPDLTLTLVYY